MEDHTNRPDPAADDAHDLLPGWLAATVPALYSQEGVETPLVRVKFFTPDAQWTWFVLSTIPPSGSASAWCAARWTSWGTSRWTSCAACADRWGCASSGICGGSQRH